MQLTREELLMKLGAARAQPRPLGAWSRRACRRRRHFQLSARPNKLRQARGAKAGICCAPTSSKDPAKLWHYYLQLMAVEEAFKNLKGDLAIRPVFHQLEGRIEAHVFIAFLAYCLHVTLARRLHALAPGLTPRSVFEKFAALQMIDVHLPTTDGRELVLTRYTEPEPELSLLNKFKLELPAQPPPKITASPSRPRPCSADLRGPYSNINHLGSHYPPIGQVGLRRGGHCVCGHQQPSRPDASPPQRLVASQRASNVAAATASVISEVSMECDARR